MLFIDNLESLDLNHLPHPHVLTLGVFDGLHRAHQTLIKRTIEESNPGTSIVFTFSNHPLSVLAPPYAPKPLTSPERKQELIAKMGADVLVMPEFTPELSAISHEKFVENLLVDQCSLDRIVVGFDSRFGRTGLGDIGFLRECATRFGFDVDVLPAVYHDEWVISSTRIRELIEEGRVRIAGEMLGRPYDLAGPVVHGFGRGRELGFPTANVEFDPQFVAPPSGVYAVFAADGPDVFKAMMNIGTNPTFSGVEVRAEAFLFDFDGRDLYGKNLRILFCERIREERKFPSIGQLIDRLKVDEKLVRAILKKATIDEFHL